MLISISVLHNIMWSIGKKITHKAKGKNSTSIWALVDQDANYGYIYNALHVERISVIYP